MPPIRPVKGARSPAYSGNAQGKVTGRGGLADGHVLTSESRSSILAKVDEWMLHSRPGDFFTVTVRRDD